jgi:hypothetical protein
MQLHPIAIPEGLRRHHRDLRRRLHLPQPLQRFHQNRPLGSQLIFIRRVLIVAPTAAPIYGARRRHAVRRSLQHFQHAGPHQAWLLLLRVRQNALSRQYERCEHHAPVQARQSVAAVHQLFHGDFKIAYDRSYPFTYHCHLP